jgi:hypothetical protein
MMEATGDAERLASLDERRRATLVSRDMAALEEFLSDNLVHIHASGVQDSKVEFIEKVSTGRLLFVSVDCENLQTWLHGDLAVLIGIFVNTLGTLQRAKRSKAKSSLPKCGLSKTMRCDFRSIRQPVPPEPVETLLAKLRNKPQASSCFGNAENVSHGPFYFRVAGAA